MRCPEKKRKDAIFFAVFLLGMVFGEMAGGVPACAAKEPMMIRVALVRGPEAVVSVSGAYEVYSLATGRLLVSGKSLKATKIAIADKGIRFRDTVFATEALRIVAKRAGSIMVGKRGYDGEIRVFKDEKGVLVVNVVDLESYLKGVVPYEISAKWPIDALKAQAVAARTYALSQMQQMKSKKYDVSADTASQVYGGVNGKNARTNRAVDLTQSEVLIYQGRVFPAYFHATCGGMTEDASELWDIQMPPLAGHRVCLFCEESPHYYWKAVSDFSSLQEKLGSSYKLKQNLVNIKVAERNATGRVRSILLEDQAGQTMTLSAKDLRRCLGADVVRSTNFTMDVRDGRVFFSGKGWGHGVGLCQWGALGMAAKGYSYGRILEFYYPGTKVTRIL